MILSSKGSKMATLTLLMSNLLTVSIAVPSLPLKNCLRSIKHRQSLSRACNLRKPHLTSRLSRPCRSRSAARLLIKSRTGQLSRKWERIIWEWECSLIARKWLYQSRSTLKTHTNDRQTILPRKINQDKYSTHNWFKYDKRGFGVLGFWV